MANKSVGQWVGTIVGAVIGFFIPGSYVALGAAIGGAIGGAIDPPKGPKIIGPRLSDLSVQTASYGSAIPRVYGTVGLYGTVVWIENNQLHETEHNDEQGGKGGGGSESQSWTYSATIAILLCEGPIVGVRRIWAGSKLIYDASDSSVEGMIASNNAISGITIYNGDESQTPNARMQMTLGVGNVPAFRGMAYAVLEDFQLADYGNSLLGCPFKFEVMSAADYTQYSQPSYHSVDVFPRIYTYGPCLGRIESGVMRFDHLGTTYTITANGELLDAQASTLGIFPAWGHVGMLGYRSVDYLAASYEGWLTVGGAQLMYHYQTSLTLPTGVWHMMGACVDKSGTRLYVLAHHETDHSNWLNIYDADLNLISQGSQSVYPFVNNAGSFPLIQGTSEVFTVEEGGDYLWYAAPYSGTVSVYPIVAGVVGSALHSFSAGTTPFMGQYGSKVTIAAADAMCWGAHDGGGMFIFSRAAVAAPALVTLASIIQAECLSTGYLSSGDLDTTTITDQVRGYRVANNAAVRSALEALQAPYPFDVIQDGYKIKFVRRGSASVATIAYDDMAATADAKTDEPRITVIREMDAQLPRRIEVSYFDAGREYDTGEQAAERLNATGTGLVRVEVPTVMTADEGARCAETLLYLYYLERLDIALALPTREPYHRLQPADPISVVTPEATYFCRITGLTHESNRVIKLTARLADVALYSPTAKGEEATVQARPVTLVGPSIMTLLDIPVVSAYNETPGLVVAARGAYTGWRGGTVLRSDDGGVSWTAQAGMSPPGATTALATNAIGTAPTNAMDVSSVLNIKMSTGDISSVSELALFNGANHFAYGEPGRWEIIGARTVTLQGDGSYNLTNLLRGRYGTEWAMSTHVALDDVILLTSGSLNFAAQPTSSIGSARQWTILGYGDSGAQQNSRTFTYNGENLECRAPCYAKAYRNPGGDFVIEWVRRSRTDDAWRDYVDAAIGEPSENYEVEIYDGPAYAVLKRTITGLTTQTATYTAAQQTTDFGAVQKYIYAKIYQVSANVGNGYPLSTFLGNPKLLEQQSLIHFEDAGDLYWSDVVMSLRMNGTNGSTTFVDDKGLTVTNNGSATISTAQSKWPGGQSGLFNGSSQYLSLGDAFSFGSGNFCIDAQIFLTGYSAGYTGVYSVVIVSKDAPGNREFAFTVTGTASSFTGLSFIGFLDNSTYTIVSCSFTFSLNTFYHVRAERYGNNLYLYVNGSLINSGAFSLTIQNTSTAVTVGAQAYTGYQYYFPGHLDDVIVTKRARSAGQNFTAPAAEYSTTQGAIYDSAGNSITITGSPSIDASSKMFGASSGQFLNSSGYITTPQILMSATQWVVDFWYNPNELCSIGYYSGILQFGLVADGVGGFAVGLRHDGLLMGFFDYSTVIYGGVTISAGSWYHGFIQRSGNSLSMGSNGQTGAVITVSGTPQFLPSVPRAFDIGHANLTNLQAKPVRIDEFSVRLNQAPYPTTAATAYTVPTSQFPDP